MDSGRPSQASSMEDKARCLIVQMSPPPLLGRAVLPPGQNDGGRVRHRRVNKLELT